MRKFPRKKNTSSYKRLFVIACEGEITEPEYFRILENIKKSVAIKILTGHKNSPNKVLDAVKKHLVKNPLKKNDYAWLVLDCDQWEKKAIEDIVSWVKVKPKNHGIALSSPRFGYWLLLHFEEGNGLDDRELKEHLKRYIVNYEKGIAHKANLFTRESIEKAIARAKKRDMPPCDCWSSDFGKTTVYRLVQAIFDAPD